MNIKKYLKKREKILERMIWVGCNPDNPELLKKQSEEGFKLIKDLNQLNKEFMEEKINEKYT